MRILFLSYAYPNALHPGLGTFNRTMLAGLAREHTVRVVSPVPWTERLKHPGRWDAAFSALPNVFADYPTFWYTPKVCRERYGQFLEWSIGRTARTALREFQPDVVLSYWTHPDGEVATRLAHEFGIPGVVMVGGSDILLLARQGQRRAAILDVLHRADAVLTVSDHLAETLIDDGVLASKIHVVRRGIDRQVFHRGDRVAARRELDLPLQRPVLIGVGRLVPVKAWPDWVAACRQLTDRGADPACYILGNGPLQGTLQRQIRSLRLDGTVELRGSQSQSELAKWYRAADLTVLSSLSEGVPNVLLETQASGGSFVATDVGGIAEIADPVHDRLVPPGHPHRLADAIADRLAHSPPAALPRRFEPPSLETAARQLSTILQSLTRKPTVPFVSRNPSRFYDAALSEG